MVVTNDAHNFLSHKRLAPNEPYYVVVDRLIREYRMKDISKLSEEVTKWKNIANVYLERAIEAETKLKDRQMKLV